MTAQASTPPGLGHAAEQWCERARLVYMRPGTLDLEWIDSEHSLKAIGPRQRKDTHKSAECSYLPRLVESLRGELEAERERINWAEARGDSDEVQARQASIADLEKRVEQAREALVEARKARLEELLETRRVRKSGVYQEHQADRERRAVYLRLTSARTEAESRLRDLRSRSVDDPRDLGRWREEVARWAARFVTVGALMLDPAIEWNGGPYDQAQDSAENDLSSRADAWSFLLPEVQTATLELLEWALDVLEPREMRECEPPALDAGGEGAPSTGASKVALGETDPKGLSSGSGKRPRKRSPFSAGALDAAASGVLIENPDWNRAQIARVLDVHKQRLYERDKLPKLKLVEERILAERCERRARLADLPHRGSLDEREDE